MLNIYFKTAKGNRIEQLDQVRDGAWINASHLVS